MARNGHRARRARRTKKIAAPRTLCVELLEPRTLLSGGGVLGQLEQMTLRSGVGAVMTEVGAAAPKAAPTVVTPAAATLNPATGTTLLLSVLGVDGNDSLKYTWTAARPAGAAVPVFTANGATTANNTTVTLKAAGTYTFTATIADGNLSTTSSVTVTVSQTLTSIRVGPSLPFILSGGTQQFSATGLDQFGNAMATQPAITWGASAGTIGSSSGVLTAPTTGGAAVTVTASSGSIQGAESVMVAGVPTVATAASAASSAVTGNTVQLSVLGAFDGGESNLKYSWAATSLPGVVVAPTFSANGANAAKNTTVTFHAAGMYTFTVTITDPGNRTVASSVTVTVDQTLTRIIVSPSVSSMLTLATQQFSAWGFDQFGAAMPTQPTVSWAASRGVISPAGVLTAPGMFGAVAVTATCGTIKGTASVTILNQAPTVAVAAASNSVTGTTVQLSVLGADDAGESNLKYTWYTTTLLNGAVEPRFSVDGTNAAKNTTVTFTAAGTYGFTVEIVDSGNLSVTSSVTVTVSQTLTSIRVTPSVPFVLSGGTQQFSATAYDQFGKAMATQPGISWGASAGEITSGGGLFTAPTTGGATTTVTASSGSIQGAESVLIADPPTVATAAAAKSTTVTGSTVQLSVLGAFEGGESNLKYTWAATTLPGGVVAPTFSANGANAAKNTTVTFHAAGSYTFTVTITDPGNRTVASSVSVTVSQTLTRISVSPSVTSMLTLATQQFTAWGFDQFGAAMVSEPTVNWTTTAGVISPAGVLTAPGMFGAATVTATCGTVKGTASVTIINQAPTVATAAAAASNPVTGTTVQLSVLGADDAGESNLKYTWFTTTLLNGAVAPTFSVDGTNAAKNTTVTFTSAGTYGFTVDIVDSGNLSVTSSVMVTVSPTLSSIRVGPSVPFVLTGGTQQFSATGYDQFGKVLAAQPGFSWSASAGTIGSNNGVLTAAATGGAATTVTAASGSIHGSESVLIADPPTVATAASAATSTVTGNSVALSVLGAFEGGEGNLEYTWAATSVPSGAAAPSFNASGTNAAKNTTVTFHAAGSYTLTATIFDPGFRYVTSSVTVTVSQTLGRISVSPSVVSIYTGATQQFTLAGTDQFGAAMATMPTVAWSATTGLISSAGVLTAPATAGTATVTATCAGLKAMASVTINNSPPTVAIAAAAASSTVTGTTVALSVLGADQAGQSTLKYTWVATTLPGGATAPTFSANGTNAAQDTTVTFHAAGSYTFTATITDSYNLSTTSSVTVTVSQVSTSIAVTPANMFVLLGGTQQYSASLLDQFGNAMAVQPAFTWAAGVGTITSGGLLTAPRTAGTDTITASSGTFQGSTGVTYSATCFLGLHDAALAGLTQSLFARDGSITRLDMIAILQSVAADGTVSATDFGDLKTIVADATTLDMPGCVKVLASDVVDGNLANAHFQGQTLGDLAAGSPGSQLTTLIDKWFYGDDLPAIGVPANEAWYQLTSGSLFNGTPSHNDEFQGCLGDCYYITSLGTTADHSPAAVENMFIDNGDGTWTVRFYDPDGAADYVTVNRMLPVDSEGQLIFADYGSMYNNPANTLWIPLAEKAYAEWDETGMEGRGNVNEYADIQGGLPCEVYPQLVGGPASSYSLNAATEQSIISALANNMAVAAGTDQSTNPNSDALAYGLYGCHAYGVIAYNSATQLFTLYNPWGFDQPQQLTWAELEQTCFEIDTANVSNTVPISAGVESAAAPLGLAPSGAAAADTAGTVLTAAAGGGAAAADQGQASSSAGGEVARARDRAPALPAGDSFSAASVSRTWTPAAAGHAGTTPWTLSPLESDAFFRAVGSEGTGAGDFLFLQERIG
jgi:hypothetical protein